MLQEFKKFALRGNVLDMAVGVIIGGAFGKITTSLVNDVMMPPVGLLISRVNFNNLFLPLSAGKYPTLEAAKEAGIATINYGLFLTTVIDFLIVAFVIFLLVRQINRVRTMMEKAEPAAEPATPTTKECPYCISQIPMRATRCGHCTAEVPA